MVKKIKKIKEKKPRETKGAKKVAKKPTQPAVGYPKKVEKPEAAAKPVKYLEGLGRRKTAVAQVRLFTLGEKTFLVNGKPIGIYFPAFELQQVAKSALEKMNCLDKFGISVKVKGGGFSAQVEAIRHGIARALVLFNPDFRKRLKKAGFLTRDSRMRERKKFGLKRARRAPQWSKR